jgi:hypothetical protein
MDDVLPVPRLLQLGVLYGAQWMTGVMLEAAIAALIAPALRLTGVVNWQQQLGLKLLNRPLKAS